MKVKTRNILGEQENEFTTDIIFQSGDSFFLESRNGGTRGAHDSASASSRSIVQELTRDQALARLASWGIEEVDIEDKE